MTSEAAATSARRRPKGDKRERTRAKLVQATAELIREKGYEATSLVDIAARAGMTTGAIYGNFKNRDELFMAVGEIKGAPITPKIWPGMSFADLMRSMADAIIAAMPQRRAAILGALGFHSYTLTHAEFQAGVIKTTAEVYRAMASGLGQLIPAEELPMPAETLVPVVHALTDGLFLQRFLTPELVPDEVIYAAFAALAHKRD